jgi:pectin methylesterase-like acyl-CoA thioesterase
VVEPQFPPACEVLTARLAAVNLRADNFTGENVTFANNFNRTHEQVPVGSQALALLVTGDRAVFRNVRLLGNQDTVYAVAVTGTAGIPGHGGSRRRCRPVHA